MIERLRFGWLPRALVAGGLLLGGLFGACSDDPVVEDRPRGPNNPGGLVVDGGADVEGSLCPPSEPKVGENCPSDEESQLRCTFIVGTCQFGGSNYDITLDYCCQRGVHWESCGTNSTPCDREVPDAPAASPIDAGAGG
jgi:hypothetical protein